VFNLMGNVKVKMADLEDSEKESLAKFLLAHFKLNSSLIREGLELNSDDVSSHELARMVNKFLGSKRLNLLYWVSAGNNEVKLNKFHHNKEKKNKHPTSASTITHGW
jgi:hypothetical protein